ncbi:MAG: hypothetical protein CSA62_06065 [Planctomycetota bacterium]|nr:MAG: hypothetical protein CSA62_06065 [Planctomycetota bacterium]
MSRKDKFHLSEQDEEFGFLFKETRAQQSETPEAAAPTKEATIQGDLSAVDLSDIFQTITMSRMTGTLIVQTAGRKTGVHFDAGRIRVAPPLATWISRISRRLLASGLTDKTLLRSCLMQVAREGKELGTCLEEEGGVPRDQFESVQLALEEDCLLELFTNRKGHCDFYRDSFYQPEYEKRFASALVFEGEQLLFEVARKSDEWGQILSEIGSLSEIFIPTQPYNEQGCDEIQIELLGHLDGSHKLSDAAGAMLDSLFDVAKAAQELRLQGKIEKVTTRHLIGLAKAEIAAQHKEQAREFLDLIHEFRNPSNSEEWEEIASVYTELGSSRDTANAYFHAAQFCESRDKSKGFLRKAHSLDNLNVKTLESLHLLLLDEEFSEAEDELLEVIDKLANCYEANGEYAKSLEMLEDLAELNPRSVSFAGRRARMLIRLNRHEDALQLLRWIASSLKLEKQWPSYAQVLEHILKIDPEDAEARRELHRIRSRVDPRLVRGAIAAAVLTIVGSIGWSFYSAHQTKLLGRERLAQAQELLKQDELAKSEQIALKLAEEFLDDEIGPGAAGIVSKIRHMRKDRAAAKLKAEQSALFGGLNRAANAFENSDWPSALKEYSALSDGIAKKKPKYRKKVQQAVEARFGTLAKDIEKNLAMNLLQPLPSAEDLRSPQQRSDALKTLDRYYPKSKCNAYIELSKALRDDEQYKALIGLPPKLLEHLEQWSQIAVAALDLRSDLEAELRNDRKKVGIDSAFSEAEKLRNRFDFKGALKLYEDIVRDYRGDSKLEKRFRQQRDALSQTVRLLAEIDQACEHGDYPGASSGLQQLKSIFPDLDFDKEVALPLRIETSPKGATILVDEKVVGTSPMILRLTPSVERTLEVRLDGFSTHRQQLPIKHGGRISISFELTPSWQRPLGGPVTDAPLVAKQAGLVVLTDRSGRVAAHDLKTGKRRWEKRYSDLSGALGEPLLLGQNVVLPSRDGQLRCLSLAEGKEVWSSKLEGPLLSPALVQDQEVWVGTESGTIHRVAIASGAAIGTVLGQGSLAFGPQKLGRKVFVLDRRGHLRALDQEGEELWSCDIEEAGLAPLTTSPHGLLVPDGIGKLHLLSEEDGRELAVYKVGDTLRKGVTAHKHLVVLANGNRELILLDLVAGKQLLRIALPSFASAAPSVLSERILVPLENKSVLVFDLDRGQKLLRLALGLRIEARITGGDGFPILLASSNSRLLAYPEQELRRR